MVARETSKTDRNMALSASRGCGFESEKRKDYDRTWVLGCVTWCRGRTCVRGGVATEAKGV